MGELCVSYYHLLVLGNSFRLTIFLGVKGREKQTVGEVYELFESVLPIFCISPLITHIKTSDSV